MKIMHISTSYPLSGGAKQAVMLASLLKERGHEVHFCVPRGGSLSEAATKAELCVHHIPVKGFINKWKASRIVRKIAKKFGIDVVHSHHTGGHNIALMATFGGGFPPVIVKRGVTFEIRNMWKFNTKRIARVAALTPEIRDILIKCGVKKEKIDVVRHIISLPSLDAVKERAVKLRRELEIKEKEFVVGSVGNGRPEKGFQYLLRACLEWKNKGLNVRVVLVGNNMEGVMQEAKRLCLDDTVMFLGYRSDASNLMAMFDVFVFAGFGMDSLPNVVLEAMAVGKPVVVSDINGICEAIGGNGVCGVTFAKGDYCELSNIVERLYLNKEDLNKMGQAARLRIRDMYSGEKRVQEVELIYKRIIKSVS